MKPFQPTNQEMMFKATSVNPAQATKPRNEGTFSRSSHASSPSSPPFPPQSPPGERSEVWVAGMKGSGGQGFGYRDLGV